MTVASEPAIIEPTLGVVHPHRLRTRFFVAFLLGLAAVLAIGVGALYAYDQQYQGRILPGVRVGAVNLSGLTSDGAAARLHAAYDALSDGEIVVSAGGKPLVIPYSSVGRAPDVDAMVIQAMSIGRGGNPIERAIANTRAAVRGITLDPQVRVDANALSHRIESFAAAQRLGPIDATITRTKTGYVITEGIEGKAADPSAAIATLMQTLGRVDAPPSISVELPLSTLEPALSTTDARSAVDAANRIAADIRIVDGTETWTISAATVRSWMTFKATGSDGNIAPAFDASGLDPIIKTLAKKVNRAAQDADLKLVDGHVVVTGTSRAGRTLDAAGMKAAIISEIGARQAGAPTSPVAAIVKVTAPKLTTADANAFAGKMRQISSFSVYYFVIVNNHWGGNIEAPATKINGTVVPAGGIFDFWKVVGDLRKLPGTGPGNAIEGGKITVTGAFGGGICTTSTTLFNAAFRAGMVPLARQNHNEFINRYPPGLDATVWIIGSTKQTMSFLNDTKYPILITRTITNDGSRRWISFKIWSVPNGRTYKISNLVIKPGPSAIETVVRDPTKPVGYYFRNNAPADGAKVWVTLSIFDHGTLHWTKRYFSNYPAVNGVTIVGTRET
jgi:vancomycin resistance protein YoaR